MKIQRYSLEVEESRNSMGDWVLYDEVEDILKETEKLKKSIERLVGYARTLDVPYEVGEEIVKLEKLLKT